MNCFTHWKEIYPVGSVIYLSNKRAFVSEFIVYALEAPWSVIALASCEFLPSVAQKVDSAIHRINRYPEDKYYETNCATL